MKEVDRISSLFEKLYNGHPWLDVNIYDNLHNITAKQAAKRAMTGCNSIWEITNHIIEWRLNVLKRMQGKIIKTPSNNYIKPVKITTDQEWQATLNKLKSTQESWIVFLAHFDENEFQNIYPPNEMTNYEHIHGIIQHDAYHLGQIVLLSKFI